MDFVAPSHIASIARSEILSTMYIGISSLTHHDVATINPSAQTPVITHSSLPDILLVAGKLMIKIRADL